MKNLILIVLSAAAISTSCAFSTDGNRGSYTAAEEDFISACLGNNTELFAGIEKECISPEVIIVDLNGDIFARGDHENEIIKNFIKTSDYLTEVQGTTYYRINSKSFNTVMENLALK